ncbi:alpha/beta hydrolase family protein [Lutispora saccharofermentans]|uniref:S9 family peptidase n=1 Tax=Lutispora saccharofermentans TaxID=3024236 RepID=A0ABT1NCD6_9FIRM|nr:S9 family peptidase [Lutispora saccharofermentans]MCQ1528925.1 S9 family peptidase [Lutispora saccharofermentans]
MENIRIDDFKDYSFLSDIEHSPDGCHACFAVHKMDMDENKYLSNLWVYSSKDGRVFQLTSLDSERSFIWMDDETILFPDIRNEKDKEKVEKGEDFTQYYQIGINGGEALKSFRIPRKASSIKMIDENTYLFASPYNAFENESYILDDNERDKELKRRKEEKDYEVLEEIPFWSNGRGFISKKRSRLYLYCRDTKSIAPITDENISVLDFNLNEKKDKIVFIANGFEGIMPRTNDIYLYDIKSKDMKKLTESGKLEYEFAGFISESKLILLGSDLKRYGVIENKKFYIVDLNECKIKCITPELDKSIWNSVGSDCRYGSSASMKVIDGHLYFITTEVDSSYLNSIDENGVIKRIIGKKGSVDAYSINNSESLFIGMRDLGLQELYKLEGENEVRITGFNAWVHDKRSIAPLEKISVETAPGVVIHGWVIKPVDFVEGKKYPAILDIHGGPKTVYGEVFFHEMQYWANHGYAVFICNPRGSDGRGNDFADLRCKYGTIDYEDIMKFTDAVLEKYSFIDSERIGVTGGSYGGFMTNWIIGHTDRFKAAASQRSISNWISKFCTTDIGYFFVDDQQGATPWNNEEKLWWHSPLRYADKVKTPTLFIHSDEDYRCWLAEGIQMFTALKYHGVAARLCMFRGENHELSRSGKPKHRLRRLKEMTDWFDKYLK